MEGEERKRKKFPSDGRIPYLDRVLREAGRLLTQKEIMAALGWTEKSDGTSTRKTLLRHPERYRRARGTKRNEQWGLAETPVEVRGALPTPEVAPPPVLLAATRHAVADTGRAAAAAAQLERIRGIIKEFRGSPFDPHRALFVLGEIAGIIGEPTTEKPPTEPAA